MESFPSKVPPFHCRHIPVQEAGLCIAGERAAFDGQFAIIIILDGIQAAAKGSAIDRHDGELSTCIVVSVIPTVFDEAGKLSCSIFPLVNGDALIDRHGTMVQNGIIRIASAILFACTLFLAASIRASIQNNRTAVINGSLLMRYIVNCAGTFNGQCTACGDFNGICTGLVGQLLAIQIERNFIVRFHFQSTTGQRNIALKDTVPCSSMSWCLR